MRFSMRRHFAFSLMVLLASLLSVSCTTYKSQEVPFRHPSAYAGMKTVAGAQVAADDFADERAAKEAFGFNVREAGLLPVQVIVDNAGTHPLLLVPEQTFLVDAQGNMWNLMDSRTAYERVEQSTEYGRIAKGAGRTGLLGAAGGAVIGAAIGVLTGENVGTAATKGAALGGAGGAVVGGAQAGYGEDAGQQIARDLANKQLENQAIQPGDMGRGFLFFPGEAPSAVQLRLQLKETDTGATHTLMLPL